MVLVSEHSFELFHSTIIDYRFRFLYLIFDSGNIKHDVVDLAVAAVEEAAAVIVVSAHKSRCNTSGCVRNNE